MKTCCLYALGGPAFLPETLAAVQQCCNKQILLKAEQVLTECMILVQTSSYRADGPAPDLLTGDNAWGRTCSAACLCGDETAMMTLASHTLTVPVLWAMATLVTCHFCCTA
jgi:hypothetical protein